MREGARAYAIHTQCSYFIGRWMNVLALIEVKAIQTDTLVWLLKSTIADNQILYGQYTY